MNHDTFDVQVTVLMGESTHYLQSLDLEALIRNLKQLDPAMVPLLDQPCQLMKATSEMANRLASSLETAEAAREGRDEAWMAYLTLVASLRETRDWARCAAHPYWAHASGYTNTLQHLLAQLDTTSATVH